MLLIWNHCQEPRVVISSSGAKQKQSKAEELPKCRYRMKSQKRIFHAAIVVYAEMVLYGSKTSFGHINEVGEGVVKQIFHPCIMHVSTMPIRRHGSSFSWTLIRCC